VKKVIFIIGISARSGTNFLKNILVSHPECEFGNLNGEDNLLNHIDTLDHFLHQLNNSWNNSWNNSIIELQTVICNAILSHVIANTDDSISYVVCKTPKPNNLDSFNSFFPDSKLIILLRDGRDIIDSYSNTFNSGFIRSCRQWYIKAQEVNRFLKSNEPQSKFLVVKYENLLTHHQEELARICEYLGISLDHFPKNLLDSLPLVGSSQVKSKNGLVEWSAKTDNAIKDLTFIGRHRKWSIIKRIIFNLFFKRMNNALGYNDTKGK
jgi:hypothetical protein